MTPFIAPPAPRQPIAAAAPARQNPAPDASDASDPFALHLDAATEKVAAARSDQNRPGDSRDAALGAATPQKSHKDAAKKSADSTKNDDSDTAPAAESPKPADTSDDQNDSSSGAPADNTDAPTPQDACHQQDALFAQALANLAVPQPVLQPKPVETNSHVEPAASVKLPDLPENPALQKQAAADLPKSKDAAPQAKPAKPATPELPATPAAHDAPKAVAKSSQQSPDPDPDPAPAPADKPSPRTSAHVASYKGDGQTSESTNAAPTPLAQAAANISIDSADIPKPLSQAADRSEPAPAANPIPAAQPSPMPAAQSADSTRAAQDSQRSQSENTFDQVVLGLRTKMDAANQKAQIELNPPNLGKLHVSVELSNGLLTAQFKTSSDVVRDLLSSHMDQLRSVLEGQGIAVDKLAVSAGSAPGDANPQANGSANQSHDGRSGGAFSNDRHTPRQSSDGAFSKMWRTALDKEEPIDLLA